MIVVSVGASAQITAATITVTATHNVDPPSYSDGLFDGTSGVNTSDGLTPLGTGGASVATGNRITFTAQHGLSSGQLVTYENGGNTSIGGLTDGRRYAVLVPIDDGPGGIDPRFSLQLGATFDASTDLNPDPLVVDPTVNVATDEIRFPGAHNLVTGDRVLYMPAPKYDAFNNPIPGDAIGGLVPGQIYLVNVIDARTIKLQNLTGVPSPVTVNGSVRSAPTSSTRPTTSSTASRSPTATSRASRSPARRSSCWPAATPRPSRLPRSEPGRRATATRPSTRTTTAIFLGSNPDADGKFQTGHGFSTGQAVYYARTGGNLSTIGVAPNTVYYARVVDAFRIQLADTYCHAVGGFADPGNCDTDGDDDDGQIPVEVLNLGR